MRKALKFFGVILSTLVLFVIVASLAFYHLIHAGELQRFFQQAPAAATDHGHSDTIVGTQHSFGLHQGGQSGGAA